MTRTDKEWETLLEQRGRKVYAAQVRVEGLVTLFESELVNGTVETRQNARQQAEAAFATYLDEKELIYNFIRDKYDG